MAGRRKGPSKSVGVAAGVKRGPTKEDFRQARDVLRSIPFTEYDDEMQGQVIDLAVSLIQMDYYADVKGVAKEMLRRVKDGEISSRDDFEQQLNESVDGTQRVIYTFQAKLGMLVTENADAWEELGLEHPTVEQMMFCAMEADVRQEPDFQEAEGLVEDG
jgi:hypothetical protein